MKLIPIVIPSYEPDKRLLTLLMDLRDENLGPVILINDGSKPNFDPIFKEATDLISKDGGIYLAHDVNRGKGAALKTAFNYVLEHMPEAFAVITADSDGQHSLSCIRSIKEALINTKDTLILGSRAFDTTDVPWKSRAGNKITENVFNFVSGTRIKDTQTGLRGIPISLLEEMCHYKGDRFEYEMNMLLEVAGHHPIKEVTIKTIYDSKDQHQTHFNSFSDSAKIYKALGKKFGAFAFSALSSALLDLLLFYIFSRLLINSFPGHYIIVATIMARVLSSMYNLMMNYHFVFKSKGSKLTATGKYYLLAVIIMLLSAGSVHVLHGLFPGVPLVPLKFMVDAVLFLLSYYVQNKSIFK